jgi:phenylacetate-CoA ligase
MEYLGRSDDAICVGLLNFRYRDVAAALETFAYSALQVVVSNDGGRDRIIIRMESDATDSNIPAKARAVLLEAMHKVQDNLDNGSIASFEVEIHALGSLPRNPRSGKIKQFLDERA